MKNYHQGKKVTKRPVMFKRKSLAFCKKELKICKEMNLHLRLITRIKFGRLINHSQRKES